MSATEPRRVDVPLVHLRVGLMNEMQYRANFFVQVLQTIVFTGTGLIALARILRPRSSAVRVRASDLTAAFDAL